MFVGSGSVNLKPAFDAHWVSCTVSLPWDRLSSGSLPHRIGHQPAQCRARSGVGTSSHRTETRYVFLPPSGGPPPRFTSGNAENRTARPVAEPDRPTSAPG